MSVIGLLNDLCGHILRVIGRLGGRRGTGTWCTALAGEVTFFAAVVAPETTYAYSLLRILAPLGVVLELDLDLLAS